MHGILGASFLAHPDLWLKPEIRPEDGVQYYSHLMCFVDDILCIHHNADSMLELLHKSFLLKPGYGEPNMYLVVKLHEIRLHNGVWTWAINKFKRQSEMTKST